MASLTTIGCAADVSVPPKGVQIMNDTSTFGSFTHSFLTRFRDEFVKLPSFSFPILSGVDPRVADVDDVSCIILFKGIYKPEFLPCTLSVTQSDDGSQ